LFGAEFRVSESRIAANGFSFKALLEHSFCGSSSCLPQEAMHQLCGASIQTNPPRVK
jgi:hypothetical protein